MSETGTFSVMRAMRAGREAIIVVDTSLAGMLRHAAAFPYLVRLVLPLRDATPLGLCDAAESERLSDVEDSLLDVVDERTYRYVGRITWNGTREILLYAADPEAILGRVRARARELDREQTVELTSEHEPSWETYRGLVG